MTNRLLLDEHFRPQIAQALRQRGFDVLAVQEDEDLLGLPDAEVYAVAAAAGRRIVTENGRDFHPLLTEALATGAPVAALLLTSPHRFPRHKANTSALVDALADWLGRDDHAKSWEDWLGRVPVVIRPRRPQGWGWPGWPARVARDRRRDSMMVV
jgi:predicted nuclease of predicted toxin-antitoxin system